MLSIVDSVCGRDTIYTIPVTALPEPQIRVAKSNDINCSNDSAILSVSGGISYTWSPALYITAVSPEKITIKPPQAITYFVQGKNASGCSGQDSIRVKLITAGIQKFYFPNAFTPDDNGTNDFLPPTFTGLLSKYSLAIYNRWGQLIFKTSSGRAGWDGRYNGVTQPAGIYVYLVTAEGSCEGMFEQKGTFALIR